ncbi:MAG: hypothetical protein NC548_41255 [Lachnospiraceae bacterium]|nr:hypothetical protein [Lachnospiraceae bacterium]
MKNRKFIILGMGLISVIYITGILVFLSGREKEPEAYAVAVAVEPKEQTEESELKEIPDITEEADAAAVISFAEEEISDNTEENADDMEEADTPYAVSFAEEEYYYTGLLKTMIYEPTIFWEQWSAIENMNVPEYNYYAILDIDADGVKELLIERDNISPRVGPGRVIDVYKENMVHSYFGSNAEFYADGIVVDSDLFMEDSDTHYITFYKDYEILAGSQIHKNVDSLTDEVMLRDGKSLKDMDTDHDGVVYVWNDFSINEQGYVETSYLTPEEYQAKMEEMLGGKEKLKISWWFITEDNLPQAAGEDSHLLDSMPLILKYIYADSVSEYPVSALDYLFFYHFYYYKLGDGAEYTEDSNRYKYILQDILPSARWISEEEERFITYNVRFDDIKTLSKEGFQQDILIEDFVAEDEWSVTDLGDGTVNITFDVQGMGDSFAVQILEAERADDKIRIKGICNDYIEGSAVVILRFDCTLQENEASPLDGYSIVDYTSEYYPMFP